MQDLGPMESRDELAARPCRGGPDLCDDLCVSGGTNMNLAELIGVALGAALLVGGAGVGLMELVIDKLEQVRLRSLAGAKMK